MTPKSATHLWMRWWKGSIIVHFWEQEVLDNIFVPDRYDSEKFLVGRYVIYYLIMKKTKKNFDIEGYLMNWEMWKYPSTYKVQYRRAVLRYWIW